MTDPPPAWLRAGGLCQRLIDCRLIGAWTLPDDTIYPYRSSAMQYRAAGWHGILPLPPGAKTPPPPGWTGGRHEGRYPSGADVQAWCDGDEGQGNICLRLPPNVVGIDVDAYDGKPGGRNLIELEARLGVLPDSWVSTSRVDGTSGIRLYRLPPGVFDERGCGRRWYDEIAPGVEIIRHRHRYMVVGPSAVDGRIYRWYWAGAPTDALPLWGALLELPMAWCDAMAPVLGIGQSEHEPAGELGMVEAISWLAECRRGDRCVPVSSVLVEAVARLENRSDGGARHEVMRDACRALVAYAGEGHGGVTGDGGALTVLRLAFEESVSAERGRDVGAEWRRALVGAVALARREHPEPAAECGCTGWAVPAEWLASAGGTHDPLTHTHGLSQVSGGVSGSMGEPESVDGTAGEVAGTAVEVGPVEALLARMLDRNALDNLPLPRPLITGVLDLDSESWIIGAPGGFKSFIALDWACHVGAGMAWQGCSVARGRVIYLVAEGKKGIRLRVQAWEKTYGVRADNVIFLPEPVQVADVGSWNVLVEACRRIGPALVVLDTQARITVGLDENSNGAMAMLTEAVRRLKEATGACVLVVHHTGRDGQDARGASAIDGAQDTELRVDRPKDRRGRDELFATVSLDKQKDGDESRSFDLQLQVVDLGENPDTGEALSSLAVKQMDPFGAVRVKPVPDWQANLTDNQTDVVTAMRNHTDESGCTIPELRRWMNEQRDFETRARIPDNSVRSAVRGLVARGAVTRDGKSRIVLTEFLD